MARLMGMEGKPGGMITTGDFKLTIVGIIKDFVYNDVYSIGSPLVFFNGDYSSTVMAVRKLPGDQSCNCQPCEIVKN